MERQEQHIAIPLQIICALCGVLLLTSASPTKNQDAGPYLVQKKGGGLFCGSRLEFYFADRSVPPRKTYLGTCGAPRFVTTEFHFSEDQSCFAISQDQSSMVYFHLPRFCGAGKQAAAKQGGVYLHSVKDGDRLLYDSSEVTQSWGEAEATPRGMRVAWSSSGSNAAAGQSFVISPMGEILPAKPSQ